MSHGRLKRERGGGAYHDPIPFDDDFSLVYEREGKIRRTRLEKHTLTAQPERTVQQHDIRWESATSWSVPDDPEFALDADGAWYDEVVAGDVMQDFAPPDITSESKKSRSKVSVSQYYLPASLALNLVRNVISTFNPLSPAITKLTHLQCWEGSFFTNVSLKSLGLKIQLNHGSMFCESPIACHSRMLVLHTNGVHDVAVQYCGCSRAIPPHHQLLRRGLYPASQRSVKTCASFELLDLLHKLALTTKSSTYDFYRALEKMTDNTGIDPPRSRYKALMRMALQWRHLKMLKWGGRAQDPAGVSATAPGELAVLCPSCPRPGVNLPEGWDSVPPHMQFLYMMFVCMDANFRLKNQLVSNWSQDPGLGIGWAYMVPRQPYEQYVLSRASEDDISTCVGLQALAKAQSKFSRGLRYTGVGGAMCGRSEMILPNGVGTLQKGERYANMDYVFASAIRMTQLCAILISYDIACQWFVNLFDRMREHWPQELRVPTTTRLIPAIPKLHEPMHGTANHEGFSLNFIQGVGKSDLEVPERVWSSHNILGNSTKTQGPGSCQDVYDDHFGFWNWLKYQGLGRTLKRRYKAAALDPQLVTTWEAICIEWEAEVFPKTKPNPYQILVQTVTEAKVKKELANKEESRLAAGGVSFHEISASAFIVMGLDLEHMQYVQAIYMPGLLQYRTSTPEFSGTAASPSHHPENFELCLPSSIPVAHRAHVCIAGLSEIEEQLRTAQCHDALESIRHILKIKSRMVLFKNKNVRGQTEGTRSRTVIDRVHSRAKAAAVKYRAARHAKLALSGHGDWENELKILADNDIRAYQDPNRLRPRTGRRGTLEDDQLDAAPASETMDVDESQPDIDLLPQIRDRRDGTGETRRTLSWIWTTLRLHDPSDATDDILRSEWAKSRARVNRSTEEVLLLKEEMRRTLEFLEWKATWWLERQSLRTGLSKELTEGLIVYAASQASLQRSLARHFRALWIVPLNDANTQNTESGDDEDEDDDDEDDEGEGNHDDGNVVEEDELLDEDE
ncbi:hypothetical protein BJ912DRAFT_842756 [Pholiota molesta]|nr:hypothetical protein BJ912DRAFT_842756 [Pholiota molesta]